VIGENDTDSRIQNPRIAIPASESENRLFWQRMVTSVVDSIPTEV